MSSDGQPTPPAAIPKRHGLRDRLRDIVKPHSSTAGGQTPSAAAGGSHATASAQEASSEALRVSATSGGGVFDNAAAAADIATPAIAALSRDARFSIDVANTSDDVRPVADELPAAGKTSPGQAAETPAQVVSASVLPSGRASSARQAAIERVLGGEWRTQARSQSFVVTRRFHADEAYGRVRVGDVANVLRTAESSARLLTDERARPPFVFFDLETTGLSGGAGTHAFLVGCSWFDADDSFVIEQHLMTEFAAERVMLELVAGELSKAGALVSFNGKSFDAPVLETRYLFHRMTSPCGELPHIDMLHPARRFWGGDHERGCTLIALESQLLGKGRIDDVPGFEIPARYFEFIRSGNAQLLADVLEHNRLDLLSLAAVTARLLRLIESGASATDDAREALALGRIYERTDDLARAHTAYDHAWRLSSQTGNPQRVRMGADWIWTRNGIRAQALRSLACVARRQRRYGDAAAYWRHLVGVPGCLPQMVREATEALAIHHEHRERDLRTARMFALRNLEVAKTTRGDAVRHRLARIERKLLSEPAPFPSLPLLPSSDSPTSGRRTSS